MQHVRRLAIGLGLLALTVPAIAAGPFDGTYAGRQTTTLTNNSATCQNMDRDISLTVKDNKVSRKWGPSNDTVEAEIKPDGSFYASVAPTMMGRARMREYILRGKITGGALEAELGSSLCGVKMSLMKKP